MFTVLHVDDNFDDLEITRLNMRRLTDRFKFEPAMSGREALDKIGGNGFDCICCDYQMPEMNGLELLKILREKKVEVPFIFLTGQGNEDIAAEALRSGADDYFIKEASIAKFNRLLNCIERNIERYRERGERQQAVEALKASEAKYRSLFENSKDVVYSTTFSGDFLDINPSGAELFGYTVDELLSMNARILYANPEDRRRFIEAISKDGFVKDFQLNLKRKNGETIHALMTTTAQRNSSGDIEGFRGIIRDVTEQKQAEVALKASEERFRSLFENMPIGLYRTTPDGRILMANPVMVKMTGFDNLEELSNQNLDEGHMFDESYSRREFVRRLEQDGEINALEYVWRKKDGSKIIVRESARAIRDAQGSTLYYEGTVEDITQQRALEQQLTQAQKLEAIGQLAAGIAHEINTPTQYIGDNLTFLSDAFSDLKQLLDALFKLLERYKNRDFEQRLVDDVERKLEDMDYRFVAEEVPLSIRQGLEGVQRVSNIVKAMKDFSHPGIKEKSAVDINKAITSTITVARNEWKYVAEMELKLDEELPTVHCLPNEINQVILNMVVNAADAIKDVLGPTPESKGKIAIETAKDGDYVKIKVSDTGSGIPEHIRSKIFDPFFTTKEVGKGTGQGLLIAHNVVVAKHGGSISFETKMGEGTTFTVRIPIEACEPQNTGGGDG